MTLYPDLKCLLQESNLVTKTFLNQLPCNSNTLLFNTLIDHHIFSELTLHQVFKKKLGLKIATLESLKIDPTITTKIPETPFYIPLYETSNQLAIAISNPYEKYNIISDKDIHVTLVPNHEIQNYQNKNTPSFSAETLITSAYKSKASDIHCYEQDDHSAIIYFRINGHLKSFSQINPNHYKHLKQHLKLEAHLDLSLYQKPQEGHIKWTLTNISIHTRLSIIPTLYGEDIACRLFNQTHTYETFTDLGIPNQNQTLLKQICNTQNGLILVTGPTGSGKTTTLYTILRYLQIQKKQNIITLEDPIEKELYGIRQTTIKPDKGFNFASGLKAILRQDPDSIMIGEIRDSETAHIALEAAYTGHLVLSSLHTHDIKSTLLRLKQFNCDEFLTNYALRGIIAQKLINPSQSYETPRYLDQEILAIKQPIKERLKSLTDLSKLGHYIPFNINC